MMVKNIALILTVALTLIGCSGNLLLIDKANKQHTGTFNAGSKTLEVKVNGKDYTGFYVTNASVSVGTVQAFSGTKSAYGTGQGFTSGNTGRAILRAADGSSMQCEFNYSGMKGIGSCVDSNGENYQLIAD